MHVDHHFLIEHATLWNKSVKAQIGTDIGINDGKFLEGTYSFVGTLNKGVIILACLLHVLAF